MTHVLVFVIASYNFIATFSLNNSLMDQQSFFFFFFFNSLGWEGGPYVCNNDFKRLPDLVFALTIVAAKAERLQL